MSRSWLVRITVLLHALVAIGCLLIVALVLNQTRKPNIVAEGRETLSGLYLGAAIVAGCALVYATGAAGLWKSWRWTWWLSLLANVVIAGALFWDPIVEREPWEWEDSWIGFSFTSLIVLLLLPAVRKFVFKREPAAVQAKVSSQVKA